MSLEAITPGLVWFCEVWLVGCLLVILLAAGLFHQHLSKAIGWKTPSSESWSELRRLSPQKLSHTVF